MTNLRIPLFALLLALSLSATAQLTERPVELRFFGGYVYNDVLGHSGNFDLQTTVPVNRHFEFDAALQASTRNSYAAALNMRPLFPLSVGELYLENRLLYRFMASSHQYDFNAALSAGYRMDYVDVRIGCFGRVMGDHRRNPHSADEPVIEPFNLLYRVEAFVRPQTSFWNLSFAAGNIDDYQMERMWQPMFAANFRYNPIENLSVLGGVECKPTGMFHLNAQFYALYTRIGIAYRFN